MSLLPKLLYTDAYSEPSRTPKMELFLLAVNNFHKKLHPRGDKDMTSPSRGRGGGGRGKNEMLSDVEGEGLASVLDVQSLSFLLKNIGFAP